MVLLESGDQTMEGSAQLSSVLTVKKNNQKTVNGGIIGSHQGYFYYFLSGFNLSKIYTN